MIETQQKAEKMRKREVAWNKKNLKDLGQLGYHSIKRHEILPEQTVTIIRFHIFPRN